MLRYSFVSSFFLFFLFFDILDSFMLLGHHSGSSLPKHLADDSVGYDGKSESAASPPPSSSAGPPISSASSPYAHDFSFDNYGIRDEEDRDEDAEMPNRKSVITFETPDDEDDAEREVIGVPVE